MTDIKNLSTPRVKKWRDTHPEEYKKFNRDWARTNAIKVAAHKKTLGCSYCKYNKCAAALEWHHPNGDKEYVFRTRGYFGPKAAAEREKCILLCSNCHKEAHEQMKTRKDLDDRWKDESLVNSISGSDIRSDGSKASMGGAGSVRINVDKLLRG